MTTTTRPSDAARAFLAASLPRIEETLGRLLPPADTRPATIHAAARYAVFGKGKRLRPALALAAAEALGADDAALGRLLPAACGLELIHTYSLVHDDLPALDDDDLRRGRATTHKVYGEAIGILAGDALLTLGLDALGRYPEGNEHAVRRTRAFLEVTEAIGMSGMIGGQVEDVEATGDAAGDADRLAFIHRTKTGCLIVASLLVGAVHAGADDALLGITREYGRALGLAFQIADDILDVTGTAEQLGKTAGKDAAQRKLTYPALYGLDEARRKLDTERSRAVALAGELPRGAVLASLAELVADRES